jgi:hypothetical protein
MKNSKKCAYRIYFINLMGVLVALVCLLIVSRVFVAPIVYGRNAASSVIISTEFTSGGGSISPVQSAPYTFLIIPHNEGQAGWSQVWWYFSIDGLTPGAQIELRIDQNEPKCAGISPQAYFTYDQNIWGLTDTGNLEEIDGKYFFIYRHTVRSSKVWFAYDLPYTPKNIEELLASNLRQNPDVEVFELCKTRNSRSVNAFRITDTKSDFGKKYGIWLQARAHAFESGGSWVLHELAKWMLSNDPDAIRLCKCSVITIIPILDVDGVVEGRTGKNQIPYDHNRGWENEQSHWPEIRKVKSMLNDMADKNMLDLFIDFHGPGGKSHPYFIVPFLNDLPYEKQRVNRSNFFNALDAKELNDKTRLTQSMTQFHYSPRLFDKTDTSSSSKWVTHKTNEYSLAFTLEVNMNTPLSTPEGYRAEALHLGKSISKYFSNNLHQR